MKQNMGQIRWKDKSISIKIQYQADRIGLNAYIILNTHFQTKTPKDNCSHETHQCYFSSRPLIPKLMLYGYPFWSDTDERGFLLSYQKKFSKSVRSNRAVQRFPGQSVHRLPFHGAFLFINYLPKHFSLSCFSRFKLSQTKRRTVGV